MLTVACLPGMLKRVAVLMLSRFTLMPLTALLLLRLGLRSGFVPATDPLLCAILLMQASMPSAQNTGTL